MKIKVLIFIVFLAGLVFSCKKSQKITQNSANKKETNKPLNEQQETAFKEFFFTANKEKILGNYDAAIIAFEKCVQINPSADAPYFEMALLKADQNKNQEALFLAEKAAQLNPNNKWYLLFTADLYKQAQKYTQAEEVYLQLLKLYPRELAYHYELANIYLHSNNLKSAIKAYEKIEELIGVTEEISVQKQKIYLQGLKDNNAAIAEITKLVQSSPQNVRYMGILADLYQQTGNHQEALNWYEKIKTIDPDNPYVQLSLADYYKQAGKHQKSEEELEKAFSNQQLGIDTKINILLGFYTISETDNREKDLALKLTQLAIKTHPNEPKIYAMAGDFYYRDKNLEKAKENYLKTIQLDKSKYLVWSQLLIITGEQNNFSEMAEYSSNAIELFPSQPSFYFFNGLANLQLENFQNSINALEAGKEMVFDNPELLNQFYSTLGDAYNSTKQYNLSDENFEKALDINPNNIYVLNNYSYYLSLRKEKLDVAEQMAKKCNQLSPKNPSYLDTYAWVLYQKGNYPEAEKIMTEALLAGGNGNAVLLEHMGDILFKLNKVNEALEYWKNALLKDPKNNLLIEKINAKQLND